MDISGINFCKSLFAYYCICSKPHDISRLLPEWGTIIIKIALHTFPGFGSNKDFRNQKRGRTVELGRLVMLPICTCSCRNLHVINVCRCILQWLQKSFSIGKTGACLHKYFNIYFDRRERERETAVPNYVSHNLVSLATEPIHKKPIFHYTAP